MPTPTYTPIATITLTSSDSEVVFSSIPATYRDLILVIYKKFDTANDRTTLQIRVNGDSGSNYTRVEAGGTGSTTSSTSATQTYYFDIIGSSFSTSIHQFLDYSATDKHKVVLSRLSEAASPSASQSIAMVAQRWANTAAISSINFTMPYSTFSTGTTFSLYGVAA